MDAGLGRLDGVELVVDGAGRARHVVDLVDLDIEREADIMAHQLEARVAEQVRDIGAGSGEEVVRAQHVGASLEQALAEE